MGNTPPGEEPNEKTGTRELSHFRRWRARFRDVKAIRATYHHTHTPLREIEFFTNSVGRQRIDTKQLRRLRRNRRPVRGVEAWLRRSQRRMR